MILSRFQGMPQVEWVEEVVAKFESSFGLKKGAEKIIGFDENLDYTATKHISTLFNAILYQNPIKVKSIDSIFEIHRHLFQDIYFKTFTFGQVKSEPLKLAKTANSFFLLHTLTTPSDTLTK